MTMFKRAMTYLGLGPDEEYDDEPLGAPQRELAPVGGPPERSAGRGVQRTATRPSAPAPRAHRADSGAAASAAVAVAPSPQPATEAQPVPRVRAVPPVHTARVEVVAPSTFDHAQAVADHFIGNQPVIVNLQAADRELGRRLIDFTSGLCYGLGGQMERVAQNVYLLTPSDVEVPLEEKRRLQARGLYD